MLAEQARLESNQLDPYLKLLRVSFKWLTLRISKSRPAACKAAALASELSVMAPHAGNAPASQPWEGCELLLFEWGIWNSDPARVELASADRQSAVLADERWILNGDWGRTRTYVVSNVADLQSAAFAARRHPTIGTSVESRTPLHSMKSYCPTARRQRHRRIFCTSTYHLTASGWLLVDLAMILSCCCIEVANDHTLPCREKRSRYILRCSSNWATVPNLVEGPAGLQPTTYGFECNRVAVCIF